MEIRAGSGLGDSIYLQSLVRHMVLNGKELIVRSNHPDLFSGLGLKVINYARDRQNCITAHYVHRKAEKGTTQWQDFCAFAGVKEPVEMRLDWVLKNGKIKQAIEKYKKPTIAVLLPRCGMNRSDGFANELLPDWKILNKLLDCNASKIQIGNGDALYKYRYIDLDLANKTSISDLLDVASVVDGFVGWCSFMFPLAESFQKPFFSLWSSRGFRSKNSFINTLTPEKVIHRKDLSYHSVDDRPMNIIQARFYDFLQEVTRRANIEREEYCADRLRAGGIR